MARTVKPYLEENIFLQSSNYNILWPPLLTKLDLLRFRCSSGHVLSKTKSMTPNFFNISDITNSSSFNGKSFRKKSMLENFRANFLKHQLHTTGVRLEPHGSSCSKNDSDIQTKTILLINSSQSYSVTGELVRNL